MRIPESIDDALVELKGLGELVTASEWKRAAIVWAFTEEVGRGKMPTNGHLSISQFARLEVNGLTKRDTVAKYRKAWKYAMDRGSIDIKPGDEFVEPGLEWHAAFSPPMPKLDRSKSPATRSDLTLEKWDESSWDCERINESKRLVRMNEVMWNALDGITGTEGEMLTRVGRSILDLVSDENKVRGIARMMHSLIEFASAYKTQQRAA